MKTNKEERIIDVTPINTYESADDAGAEKILYFLVGDAIDKAKLVKIKISLSPLGRMLCGVREIDGVSVENRDIPASVNGSVLVPPEEQVLLVKRALLSHDLSGKIARVGELYASGHITMLRIQKRMKTKKVPPEAGKEVSNASV